MATNSSKLKKYGLCCPIIAVLTILITYLLLVTEPEPPAVTITVESTRAVPESFRTVFNNTALLYRINLGVRVHNSLSNYTLSGAGPGCESTVVMPYTHLRSIDDDSRFDATLQGSLSYKAPGDDFGRKVGKFVATCRDLAVDLDRWTERVQKVDCDVSVHVLRHDFRYVTDRPCKIPILDRDYVLIYDSAASPPQRVSRRLMLVKFIRKALLESS